jgi:SAM-dependent methyltransferase
MSWRDFWNADTPIYVNERHKALHYGLIARDIVGLIPSRGAALLDYGCGEALSAGRVAAACAQLYLCDGAPLVRQRLQARFRGDPKVVVLSPEEMESVPDEGLDVIVVNSLLQYLSVEEFGELLSLWRRKLKPAGQLVLADVIPPDTRAADDAAALLAFAWKGGFLAAALKGLARTALSEYRKLRAELGLTHYSQSEMLEILRGRGFSGARRDTNLGHNPKRMTFVARPRGDD